MPGWLEAAERCHVSCCLLTYLPDGDEEELQRAHDVSGPLEQVGRGVHQTTVLDLEGDDKQACMEMTCHVSGGHTGGGAMMTWSKSAEGVKRPAAQARSTVSPHA